MSQTEPMSSAERLAHYRSPMTDGQGRRYVRRERREFGSGAMGVSGYGRGKGRPTPRRAAARAAMLERRRG